MTPEIAHFLLSEPGRVLLTQADILRMERADLLTALTRLRRQADPEQADAAWEMSDLRQRGIQKFGPDAAQMYFVREALEQASGWGAANYHAARFVQAGITTVADLCGGIGGDALAFARAGLNVTLYERDPIRALFAAENAVVCGQSECVTVRLADATMSQIEAEAAWFDPARRTDNRRVSDPDDYAPPLLWLAALQEQGIAHVGVKLSPAIDHALAARYGAELEFLSERGECKEALLWLGRLKSGDALRATLLTEKSAISLAGAEDRPTASAMPAVGRYLYEPDPGVIRAHLVGTLAGQIQAATLDPQIAYLVGNMLHATPFATAYEILERFPFSKKRLQDALTTRQVGRVIIKKRGFPIEPDQLRRQLKLRGPQEVTAILARIGKGHETFLCQPFAGNSGVNA